MLRFSPSMLTIASVLLAAGVIDASAQGLGQTGAGGAPTTTVAAPETSGSPAAAKVAAPSIQSSLGKYGDPGGIRAFLDARGIDYSFTYVSEVLGNVSGGIKRGAIYEGGLNGQLDVDLAKLAGLQGATLHANFYQIHGRGLSGSNLLDLFTVSSVEAYPSTKLYEAWLEQAFFGDKLAVRVGQIGIDTEFFVSQTATVFYNPTFGAAAILANDLPSGGPSYPLATPAVRAKIKPVENLTVLTALFNGDPAGPYRPGRNNANPQIRDLSGTLFRVGDPPILLTEAAFAYNQQAKGDALPGVVKLGYLHHFGSFAAVGVPDTSRVAYRGDNFVYGLVDQTVYRVPGTDDQGASVFLRSFAAPSDRNFIDLYVDGGAAYVGLIPGRPKDTIAASFAYGRISPIITQADARAGGPLVRDFQAIIEASYQYALVPGLTLQPEFQYVFHPGAHGVADPATGRPVGDAAVFGLRATVVY